MNIDEKVLEFLRNHRIGVLALATPTGGVHAATMHYSIHSTPLKIFLTTSTKSRKARVFEDENGVKASLVVGVSWEEWATIQLDGEASIVTDPEVLELAKAVHYSNNPDAPARQLEPETHMIEFIPSWWRYSNFQEKPPVFLGSNLGEDSSSNWKDFLFYHE